jgi:hypothetical protein
MWPALGRIRPSNRFDVTTWGIARTAPFALGEDRVPSRLCWELLPPAEVVTT